MDMMVWKEVWVGPVDTIAICKCDYQPEEGLLFNYIPQARNLIHTLSR